MEEKYFGQQINLYYSLTKPLKWTFNLTGDLEVEEGRLYVKQYG